MRFTSKLSIAVAVTAAALTEAQPFKKFGYRDYAVRPIDGNPAATGQYPTAPPPAMTTLPASSSVDPVENPTSSPTSPIDVTPSYGPPSLTAGFPTSIPADYSMPASSETGPRTVTVRPLPVSSGSGVDPIRTLSPTSASHATPTYGPPLVTGGFSTRIPADYSTPISSQTVTVTYTLGTGVETTVVTKTVTLGGPPSHQFPTPPPEAGVDPVSDSTTTLSTTSTTTVTITVEPSPTAPDNGRPGRPNIRPGRPGGPPCKPAPIVTVTERETISVTATPTAVDPTFDDPLPTESAIPTPYPTTPDEDVTSALPAASSAVTIPIKVPRPPYGTGTTFNTKPTASSGFFTRVLPMPTGGYYH